MFNFQQATEDAKLLNVKIVITRDGRIDMEAPVGVLKKIWALQGFDIVQDAKYDHCWNCYQNGQYAGCILKDKQSDFAFSYTTRA